MAPRGQYVRSRIGKSTRCKTGQASPNRGGRTKSCLLSGALRNRLAEVKLDEPAGQTFAEAIAENLVGIACSEGPSVVHAANEIADRHRRAFKPAGRDRGYTADLRSGVEAEIESEAVKSIP
jgi:hypothetical protein